jgi:pentapeptide repeat protein
MARQSSCAGRGTRQSLPHKSPRQPVGPYDLGADLSSMSRIERSGFDRCQPHQAHLASADLSGAKIHRVNLTGADLRHAQLVRTNFTEALGDEAALYGAQLEKGHVSGQHDGASTFRRCRPPGIRSERGDFDRCLFPRCQYSMISIARWREFAAPRYRYYAKHPEGRRCLQKPSQSCKLSIVCFALSCISQRIR